MNAKSSVRKSLFVAIAGCVVAMSSTVASAAATFVILNVNAAGVGFNDPTPAAPVGGNTGTTLGAQRLNAFQFAVSKWGATLTSSVTILVRAQFSALTCTATSAVLGSAGATFVDADFPGAPLPGHLYSIALANKLVGFDEVPGNPHINANFNVNLGQPGCLTGLPFYLGLDNNHGPNTIDLVTVLLHEFGHGVGFQTFTNGTTGAQAFGLPSAYDHFLFDNTVGLTWDAMTNAQRATSALNTRRLAWTGPNVTAGVPLALASGTPGMKVLTPAAVAGNYLIGVASFGAPLTSTGFTGEIMPVVDTSPAGNSCTPLNAANALAVNGKFALVDRGTCGFAVKAANVQAAGAVGMIVADNVAGSPPPDLGGVDPTITIPAVRITLADGNTLKNALKTRSRTHSGVFATLANDPNIRAGADAAGRALVFTPNPFQSGSSVTHWDTSAFPNLLMEPAINGDLTHEVTTPVDLTFPLLLDEGW